ncbi:MAG: IclR family transcriptional regulator [Haloferacaceae archaeon]
MTDGDASGRRTRTTDTAFDVIERLGELGPTSVSRLATALDLSKSTVHGHLSTLEERGYVVRDEEGYRLGLRFLDLGTQVRDGREIVDHVEEPMERLAEATGERTQFMIEEGGRGIYVHRAESSRAVPTDARIGRSRPLHACSTGKAILAHLPDARVDAIVDRRGLPALTERTITDREELAAELATVRERGYATNRGESIAELWAIGTPVFDENDDLAGALSVGGPGHRMRRDDRFEGELVNQLLGTVEEIELNVSYR